MMIIAIALGFMFYSFYLVWKMTNLSVNNFGLEKHADAHLRGDDAFFKVANVRLHNNDLKEITIDKS